MGIDFDGGRGGRLNVKSEAEENEVVSTSSMDDDERGENRDDRAGNIREDEDVLVVTEEVDDEEKWCTEREEIRTMERRGRSTDALRIESYRRTRSNLLLERLKSMRAKDSRDLHP